MSALPRFPAARTLRVLALSALSASCASYPDRVADALHDFESGRFEAALAAFGERERTGSAFLEGAEAGMVAITSGRWQAALDHLGRAAKAVEEVEQEALVSPESAGEAILSWAVNDTFRDYYGEGYERVMLHASLGLAYLALGSLEDLLVEVRLANQLLETEEKLYGTEYQAGGLGHFLSANAYELRGDLDDAYIDYRRMEAKQQGGELVGRSLVRLAAALGRDEDLAGWVERWGPASPLPEGAARVILIAGVGLGPFKQEARLDIPTRDGFLSWAVPTSVRRRQPVTHLELAAPASEIAVRSEILESVSHLAARNLGDRLAWLAAKSALRAVLKRELRKKLEDEHGVGGALIGDLFSIFSEHADLRTWSTLPDTWQAARLFLEPGSHELTLAAEGGEQLELGFFELEPGETMFILARTLQRRIYAHPIGGRIVDASPEGILEALEAAPADG